MDSTKILAMVCAVMVCSVVVVASVPMITGVTMDVVEVENDSPSWVRMAYGNSAYDLTFTTDGENISVGNQTGAVQDMILYADEKSCVMNIDGDFVIVNGYGETPGIVISDTVTVKNSWGNITITDGSTTVVSASSPAWAYYPADNGAYSFFGADSENIHMINNDHLATAGTFAGVYTYNDVCVVKDYGVIDSLVLDADITNKVINSIQWGKSIVESLSMNESDVLDLRSLDNPPNSGGGLRAVPTPTYIDSVTNEWGFNLNADNDAVIVSYSGTGGTIVIPSTVSYDGVTYDVKELGSGGNNQNIIPTTTSGTLTIPNSVIKINDYALYGCYRLNGTLTIPSSVTSIGNYAFYSCKFTGSLVIPDSVTSLGAHCFEYCQGFNGTLTLSNSLDTIPDSAFNECRYLTGTLTIPSSVETIGARAFGVCIGFTGTLTIPSSVTSIGNFAFDSCYFTGNINIPITVTNWGNGVFAGCRFTSFTVDQGVTEIPPQIFLNCHYLNDINVPNGIITIGFSAFSGCKKFDNSDYTLVIPDSVTTIGHDAYSNSNIAGTLVIPDNVTSIGTGVFNGCSRLTGSPVFPDWMVEIPSSLYGGCSGFTGTLVIPDGVTSIGSNAFSGCTGFTGILVIPDGVTSIGSSAFYGCSGFTGTLVIPDGVTSIATNTFKNCSGFTGTLVIPDGVTSIGYSAFSGCSGFEDIVIGKSTETISNNSFDSVVVSQILNLSDLEITATSYGINADEVSTDILANGYIAPLTYSVLTQKTGDVYELLSILPLIAGIGLLLVVALYVFGRQFL